MVANKEEISRSNTRERNRDREIERGRMNINIIYSHADYIGYFLVLHKTY